MSAIARAARRHAAFVLLLAFAGIASVVFTRSPGLASLGDDSVSYLLQARVYAGNADAAVREWIGTAAHFPPLFPLLLAAAGASGNLVRAHLVVALCATFALVPIYAFAFGRSGSRAAAWSLAALFLITPSAWIDQLGILSEPLYLLLSFAVLEANRRLARRPPATAGALLAFGVLLGCAMLARTAGTILVVAYAVHALLRARREERPWRLALPLAPVALLFATWMALRASPLGESYGGVLHRAAALLSHDPAGFARLSAGYVGDGWIAVFTGQSAVEPALRAFFLCVGAAGVIGAVRAASRNRLDAWYGLGYLAMLSLWLFPEETMRRLMYPIVPLVLLHAGEALHALVSRVRATAAAVSVGLSGVAMALLALPALLVAGSKATDRAVPPGFAQPLASISNLYTTLPVRPARELAGRHLAILTGLARIERFTPPGARILWMRPDYVAVLAHRTGVPWYYREGMEGVVAQLLRSGAGYLVVATLYKADLRGESTGALVTPESVAPFTRVVFVVRNPAADVTEFALLEVDRAALEAYARAQRIRLPAS